MISNDEQLNALRIRLEYVSAIPEAWLFRAWERILTARQYITSSDTKDKERWALIHQTACGIVGRLELEEYCMFGMRGNYLEGWTREEDLITVERICVSVILRGLRVKLDTCDNREKLYLWIKLIEVRNEIRLNEGINSAKQEVALCQEMKVLNDILKIDNDWDVTKSILQDIPRF